MQVGQATRQNKTKNVFLFTPEMLYMELKH